VGSLNVEIPEPIKKHVWFIGLNQNPQRRNKKCIGKKVKFTPTKKLQK